MIWFPWRRIKQLELWHEKIFEDRERIIIERGEIRGTL